MDAIAASHVYALRDAVRVRLEKVASLVGLVVSEGADFVQPEALPQVVSTRRRHDIDWQEVVRRLEQGEGTHIIGKSLGVGRGYVCGRLVDMGLPCSVTEARKRAGLPPLDDKTLHGHGRGGNKKKSIDLEAAVRLLEFGMSLSEVAPEVGVSSVTLHKRLVEAGLPTSAKAARQRAGLPVIEREVRHVELKPKPMTTSKPKAEPAAKPAPPPAPQPVFAPSVPCPAIATARKPKPVKPKIDLGAAMADFFARGGQVTRVPAGHADGRR